MKNKKGFTLTELLLVIVLLVILTGSTIFGIDEISKRSREKALNEIIKEIELATEVYFNNNEIYRKNLLNGELNEKCTRLYTLQNEDLISQNLINPLTNERIPGNLCITSKVSEEGIIEHKIDIN